jgi:hypothetical protein
VALLLLIPTCHRTHTLHLQELNDLGGPLRGLFEGLCDVAFVRDTDFDDTCVDVDVVPTWCGATSDVNVLSMNNNDWVNVPTDAFVIRSNDTVDDVTLANLIGECIMCVYSVSVVFV